MNDHEGWTVTYQKTLLDQYLGHRIRLRDDLVDWNSGVSVRPYVHKKLFRFPSNLVCG